MNQYGLLCFSASLREESHTRLFKALAKTALIPFRVLRRHPTLGIRNLP